MPRCSVRFAAGLAVGCLALGAIAACRVTDQRFTEIPAVPRLIAPSSMARVTRQAPTLHWDLAPTSGAAAVELCEDRACAKPIAIPTVVAADQRSAVPTAPLPIRCIYWRVRVTLGDLEAVSATWQFWVGEAATTTPLDVDTSHAAIFDVNGDGYADFLVGAPAARSPGQTGGVVHVYLGSTASTAGGWNGAAAEDRIDVVLPSDVQGFAAMGLSTAGDVNGDGFADFVIGTPFAVDNGGSKAGAAYLYLGSEAPSADRWNGESARDRIAMVNPDGPSATFGLPAVGIGDVNRDGYADFLLASSVFGGMQPVHVYLGSATPGPEVWAGASPPARVDLSNPDGVNSVFYTASSAGDVNGDGFADFALGTSGAGGNDGGVHVYLGSEMPRGATWNGDAPGARIDLASPDGPGAQFAGVATAGDVNGDGYADLLVGARGAAGGLGASHLYLGARDPAAAWSGVSPARIDLASPDTTQTQFGAILTSAGDVNRDGLSDFVVSGFGTNFGLPNSGTVHLYLGMRTPSTAAWNGASAGGRVDLVAPEGTRSAFGDRPLLTGDINGDRYDDLVVSALDAGAMVGAVYLYFGSTSPGVANWNGASPSRRITIIGPDPAGSEFGSMR